MSELEEYSPQEEQYGDWLSDNKERLRQEYLEEEEERFSKFCRHRYAAETQR